METAQGPFETHKPLLAMGKLTLSGATRNDNLLSSLHTKHRETQTGSPWQMVVGECWPKKNA